MTTLTTHHDSPDDAQLIAELEQAIRQATAADSRRQFARRLLAKAERQHRAAIARVEQAQARAMEA